MTPPVEWIKWPKVLPDDELIVFVGGHGYGESQVVRFPGGKIMVVDSCLQGPHHVPLDLLSELGITHVDLLVVTHTDLDHCSGVPRLLDEVEVGELWRFPPAIAIETLAHVLERSPKQSRRLKSLRCALVSMDEWEEQNSNGLQYININSRSWNDAGGLGWSVTPIAPCSADITFARKRSLQFATLQANGSADLTPSVREYLEGSGTNPSVRGNTLSLALSIEFGSSKVLLGGDVEAPSSTRGWSGVVAMLSRQRRLHYIEDPLVMKVSHHGSHGAWSDDAWSHHAAGGPVPLSIMTSFARGRQPGRPPQQQTLAHLVSKSSHIGVTAPPFAPKNGGWSRFKKAGWSLRRHNKGRKHLPHWLGVMVSAEGHLRAFGSHGSRWYGSP